MLREIFTVLDESEKYYKISLDDENHPIFKAHFPENPILPGFVLLDIAFGLFGQKDKEIKRAKFLHQIPPKSSLGGMDYFASLCSTGPHCLTPMK